MKNKILRFIPLLKYLWIYIIIMLLPRGTRAEPIPNPLNAATFCELAEDITRIVLMVGLPAAAIMIIYSGFKIVTAGGKDEQLKKGREMFFWTIIGTAVIVGARVIAAAVVNFAKGLGEGESVIC